MIVKSTVESNVIFGQVTEQARLTIEARMKETENHHRMLEEKLQEAEKQKQDLEEQNVKAQASLEEQVFIFQILFLNDGGHLGFQSFTEHCTSKRKSLLQINSLRSRLSCAEADHQAALQQVAVVEEQKQQALQDGQEQVSNW